MKREYSALDLFGGRDAVVKRMGSILREGLIGIMELNSEDRRSWLEEEGFDTPELQEKVYRTIRGEKEDCDTIQMIGESLGIDIYKVFNNPKFTAESRQYWLNQLTENPMVICGSPPENIRENDFKFRKAELRSYVKLVAESELVIDPKKVAIAS